MAERRLPDRQSLTAVLYPESGNAGISLLMNASLYFDRILVLTPALAPDIEPAEMEQTLQLLERNPLFKEALTIGSVVGPEEIVRIGRESLDFHAKARPLVDAGVVAYLESDRALREQSLAVTREWAIKIFRSARCEEVIAKAQLSLEAAGLHCGDVFLSESELGRAFKRVTDNASTRSTSENLRLAACVMMASLIAAVVAKGQVGLLTDSVVHENWMLATTETLGAEMAGGTRAQLDVTLARSVISAHVPVVEGLTADDVLEIRHRLASEYLAFRTEIRRLSDRITVQPWSDDLAPEIESMVRSDVDPTIDQLRRALERSGNLFNHFAGDLADMLRLAVPFAGSLLAGAPIEQAGALGLVSGLVGAALKTHLDVQAVKSSNVMSYVLSLESELRTDRYR